MTIRPARPLIIRSLAGPLAAGAVLVLAACGGSTESGAVDSLGGLETTTIGTEAPFTSNVDTTVALAVTAPPATEPVATESTVAPPVTTAPPAAPATTSAPAPAAPLVAADLVLRADGIGPFTFGGVTPSDFVAAVTPALGAPTDTTSNSYPTPVGAEFENDDELAFAFPVSESVCFANALCAHFGGSTAADVRLAGYVQDENSAALATASGVTSGSVWASHPSAIVLAEGGCYSTGYGTADGVEITVISSGLPFIEIMPDGTFVTQVPAQKDVRVVSLNGGAHPYFLFADC